MNNQYALWISNEHVGIESAIWKAMTNIYLIKIDSQDIITLFAVYGEGLKSWAKSHFTLETIKVLIDLGDVYWTAYSEQTMR